MTSKLKCPFCQQGLIREYNRGRDTVIYRCDNCYFQGDGIIWQALIQAKQDLEKANAELDYIKEQVEKSRVFEQINHIADASKMVEHKE